MHRSGTSMITRALHESGLQLVGGAAADALLEAADDNPEGFWENQRDRRLQRRICWRRRAGRGTTRRISSPLAVDDERVAGVVEPAIAALDGLRENPHWGFKDPRVCLTAGFWLDLEPDLRFVICVRHPLEVALSLKRRNQNSYSLGLALWERYYAAVLEAVPEDRRIVTHYDSFFVDPEAELARLCAFAGLEPAPPHVRDDLRHHEVGVGLAEANVSASLRDLYSRLCADAGVAAPDAAGAPTTDGHVRRLILDGAVAARHAEQRQQAIDRLEERLTEARSNEHELRLEISKLRREATEAEQSLHTARSEIARFKELEERIEALTRSSDQLTDVTDMVAQTTMDNARRIESVETVGAETLERVREMRTAVAYRARLRRKLSSLLAKVRLAAPPAAQKAAGKLPSPARHRLQRVKQAYDDGVAAQRAQEAFDRAAERLPAPAQRVVERGRAAGHRIPDPVRRRVRIVLSPADRRALAGAPGRTTLATPRPGRRPRAAGHVPKGPPLGEWQAAYTQLLIDHVPADARWAVITPGSPDVVRDGHGAAATRFPVATGTAPLIDALSHVAVVEALRTAGHTHLVLPEGSRPWFLEQPELRDHLSTNYRTAVDQRGAGAVFDLSAAATGEGQSLLAALKSVVGEVEVAPAVLNLTDLDLDAELPGFTCFAPPVDEPLPYFDDSVEFVVVGPQRDLADATRVASKAVIQIDHEGATSVSLVGATRVAGEPPAVVLITSGGDDGWRRMLTARAGELGVDPIIVTDPAGVDVADDAVVIIVEQGVVPLPGAMAGAVRAVTGDPTAVVAAKVLAADGTLDSAGGFVFDDGSTARIGSGSDEVRAPWHEFVRPVCFAPGLAAVRGDRWNELTPASLKPQGVLDWCGAMWASDHAVRYEPRVVAVRVDGGAPALRVEPSWGPGTSRRPRRPAELSEGVWRYLIAHDDLEVRSR